MLTHLLIAATLAPATHEIIVKEVHTHKAFAGKLGYRITEDLVVMDNGVEKKLVVDGFRYTNVANPHPSCEADQHLFVPHADKNGVFHANRWEIKIAR